MWKYVGQKIRSRGWSKQTFRPQVEALEGRQAAGGLALGGVATAQDLPALLPDWMEDAVACSARPPTLCRAALLSGPAESAWGADQVQASRDPGSGQLWPGWAPVPDGTFGAAPLLPAIPLLGRQINSEVPNLDGLMFHFQVSSAPDQDISPSPGGFNGEPGTPLFFWVNGYADVNGPTQEYTVDPVQVQIMDSMEAGHRVMLTDYRSGQHALVIHFGNQRVQLDIVFSSEACQDWTPSLSWSAEASSWQIVAHAAYSHHTYELTFSLHQVDFHDSGQGFNAHFDQDGSTDQTIANLILPPPYTGFFVSGAHSM